MQNLSNAESKLLSTIIRDKFDNDNDKMTCLDCISISKKVELPEDFIQELESSYKSHFDINL